MSISVPPPPDRRETKRFAAATLPGVAGKASPLMCRASFAKGMTRKRSLGRRPSSAAVMNRRLASIGSPAMEPEVSSTKTSSRGAISSSAGRAGGSISTDTNPPRSPVCDNAAACTPAPSSP